MFAVCYSSHAYATTVAQVVEQCLSRIQPQTSVTESICPELFEKPNGSSGSIAFNLELPEQPTTEDLVELSRFLGSLAPSQTSPTASTAASFNIDELSSIMDDYSFAQEDEGISLAARFNAWLLEKFRNSGLADKLESIGKSFSMQPETYTLILKIIGWTMGIALLVAVVSFLWVLWRFLDPSLSRRRTNAHESVATGVQRGNMPVMTLNQIRQLPANQQPPALLVACLDRLKGEELPDNIWKATNSEIVQRLTKQKSLATTPMRRLVQIAEKTLYGKHSADANDINSCFSAANEIFHAPGESA